MTNPAASLDRTLIDHVHKAFNREDGTPAYSAGGQSEGWSVKSTNAVGSSAEVTVTCSQPHVLYEVVVELDATYGVTRASDTAIRLRRRINL